MVPVRKRGLNCDYMSTWPRAALPYNPDFGFGIATPEPDIGIGYALGIDSGFTAQEAHVLYHPYAEEYTQPGSYNLLPFFVAEIHVEPFRDVQNRAAASGTYCIRAMEWLFSRAGSAASSIDSAAFSLVVAKAYVVLSIHWYSPSDQKYYMSELETFETLEEQGIKDCHNAIKNITTWALGDRWEKIKSVLETLFPLSKQWPKERRAMNVLDRAENGNCTNGDEEEEEKEEP